VYLFIYSVVPMNKSVATRQSNCLSVVQSTRGKEKEREELLACIWNLLNGCCDWLI